LGIFKNLFHYLFLEFLQKSELAGILVFHTSSSCFLCLAAFSFTGSHRGTRGLYKACMRVHVPNLHTTRVDTLADEVTVAWLGSEFFLIKEAVILSPVRSDPSQGFSGTHSSLCFLQFVA
jgi:hypothetical protein